MCSVVGRPMVQDIPEQDIVMGELELPPQMDPEPEMGAVAAEAAVYDTSPPPLYQGPPILAESAQPGTFDMAQLVAILTGMENRMENNINNKMDGMSKGMEANTNRMNENMNAKMDGMAQTVREEMQCMGAGLHHGLEGVREGQEQF